MSLAAITDQADNFQHDLHAGAANAYGAAGQLDAMPDNLKFGSDGTPLVNPIYRPGGSLYGGQGGSWVNQPPPKAQGGQQGGGRALAGRISIRSRRRSRPIPAIGTGFSRPFPRTVIPPDVDFLGGGPFGPAVFNEIYHDLLTVLVRCGRTFSDLTSSRSTSVCVLSVWARLPSAVHILLR